MYPLPDLPAPSFVHIFSQRFQYLCFARRLAFSAHSRISTFPNISNPFFWQTCTITPKPVIAVDRYIYCREFESVMFCIHTGSVFDYPRSRTRSIEWMTNRCVSDEIHLLETVSEVLQPLRTRPAWCRPTPNGAILQTRLHHTLRAPLLSAPAPQKSAIRVRGLAAVESPKARCSTSNHLIVQVLPHRVKCGCHLVYSLPSLHRWQLVPDRSA